MSNVSIMERLGNHAGTVNKILSTASGINALLDSAAQFNNRIANTVTRDMANSAIEGTFDLSVETALQNMEYLRIRVQHVATQIGTDFNTVSRSSEALVTQGYSIQEALNLVPMTNRFKNAFETDIVTMSNFIADLSRFTGLPVGEYEEFIDLIDAMTFTVKATGIPLQLLQNLLQENGATMRQMGVGTDEIGRLVIMFHRAGVASENVNQSMEHLLQGVRKLRSQHGNFLIFGDHSLDLTLDMSQIATQISSMDKVAQDSALVALFGPRGSNNLTTFNAMANITAEKISNINKVLANAQTTDFAEMLVEIFDNSPAQRMQRLNASFTNMKLTLGEMISPLANWVSDNGLLSAISGILGATVLLFRKNLASLGFVKEIIYKMQALMTMIKESVIDKAINKMQVLMMMAMENLVSVIKKVISEMQPLMQLIKKKYLTASLIAAVVLTIGTGVYFLTEAVKTGNLLMGVLGGIAIVAGIIAGVLLFIGTAKIAAWIVFAVAGLSAVYLLLGQIFGFLGKKENQDPFTNMLGGFPVEGLQIMNDQKFDGVKFLNKQSEFTGLLNDGLSLQGGNETIASQISLYPRSTTSGGERITRHEVRIFLDRGLAGMASDGSRSENGMIILTARD